MGTKKPPKPIDAGSFVLGVVFILPLAMLLGVLWRLSFGFR